MVTDVFLNVYLFIFGLTTWFAGSSFPDQGLNPGLWQWKRGVLTPRPPGNSLPHCLKFTVVCEPLDYMQLKVWPEQTPVPFCTAGHLGSFQVLPLELCSAQFVSSLHALVYRSYCCNPCEFQFYYRSGCSPKGVASIPHPILAASPLPLLSTWCC